MSRNTLENIGRKKRFTGASLALDPRHIRRAHTSRTAWPKQQDISSQFLANLERLNMPRARYPSRKMNVLKAVRSGAPCKHELLYFWDLFGKRNFDTTPYLLTYNWLYSWQLRSNNRIHTDCKRIFISLIGVFFVLNSPGWEPYLGVYEWFRNVWSISTQNWKCIWYPSVHAGQHMWLDPLWLEFAPGWASVLGRKCECVIFSEEMDSLQGCCG